MSQEERYRAQFEDARRAFSERDLNGLMGRLDDVAGRAKGPFLEIVDDVATTVRLLQAYAGGRYRSVPWGVIASLGGSLIYLLNPLDVMPDFLPFVGLLDDLAVFSLALRFARGDLDRFRAWERGDDAVAVEDAVVLDNHTSGGRSV